jgi:hypothetical protein
MNSAPSSRSASPHAAPTGAPSPASLAAWTPWFLVMTLTVLCLWLAQLYFTTQAQNSLLRDQQRLTELELRNARQHAEAERILAGRELADLRKQLAEK